MFRRRPRRRGPLRRPGSPLRPGPQQALQQANRLFEIGSYDAAADIFEHLANGAQERGMLRRAPHLYLQAARARLKAQQVEQADSLLYQGLDLLSAAGQWNVLRHVGNAAIEEYQRGGYQAEAAKLKLWLDNKLQDYPEAQQAPPLHGAQTSSPLRLPAKCTSCGASVRPNEVEWLDQTTAECLYCGSPLQTQP